MQTQSSECRSAKKINPTAKWVRVDRHLDHCWKRNEGAFCWSGSAVMQAFCFRTCFKAHGEAVGLKLDKNLGLVNPKFGLKKSCHQPPALCPGHTFHGARDAQAWIRHGHYKRVHSGHYWKSMEASHPKKAVFWPLSRIVQLWMRPMFQGSLKFVKSGEKNIEKLWKTHITREFLVASLVPFFCTLWESPSQSKVSDTRETLVELGGADVDSSHVWLVHFSMSMPNLTISKDFQNWCLMISKTDQNFRCHGYRQTSSEPWNNRRLAIPSTWSAWRVEPRGLWRWFLCWDSAWFLHQENGSKVTFSVTSFAWKWKPKSHHSMFFFLFSIWISRIAACIELFLAVSSRFVWRSLRMARLCWETQIVLDIKCCIGICTSLLLSSCWISGSCLMLPPESDPESPKPDLFSPFAALICHVLHDQCREYLVFTQCIYHHLP